MALGDHIRVRRGGYTHHGIDCGDGTVIHYSGSPKNKRHATVARTSREQFAHPASAEAIEAVLYDECDLPERAMERACSRLGETRYSLFLGNCEHFAHWCKTGRAKSRQVTTWLKAAGATAMTAGVFVAGIWVRRRRVNV